MSGDRIEVRGLKVLTRVGVPDEERAQPQEVAVDVRLRPAAPLSGLRDDIERTVDYFEVTQALQQIAARGERKLIETLAEEFAEAALAFEGVAEVSVTIRKFILPDTDWVSVTVTLPAENE